MNSRIFFEAIDIDVLYCNSYLCWELCVGIMCSGVCPCIMDLDLKCSIGRYCTHVYDMLLYIELIN
jgi:hypothetical protein